MHQRGPPSALAYRVLCDFLYVSAVIYVPGRKQMSNTAYSKPRRVPRDFYKETPTEDEPYEESEEEYEDEEPEQEALGLFSTPARTAALVTSVVVLLFVA